jgi:hypothetical protein
MNRYVAVAAMLCFAFAIGHRAQSQKAATVVATTDTRKLISDFTGQSSPRIADMQDVGCCALRNGTNGWSWSDNKSRQECIMDNNSVGGHVDDWYHYPNETCDSVEKRCNGVPC